MEVPALAVFPAIYLARSHHHPVGTLVVIMWIAHYGHRAFLWPWLVQRYNRTVPLVFCGSGILFNTVNGVLWGWFMGHLAYYPPDWLGRPLVVAGLVPAIGGAALDVWCDYRLSRMRKGRWRRVRDAVARTLRIGVVPQPARRDTPSASSTGTGVTAPGAAAQLRPVAPGVSRVGGVRSGAAPRPAARAALNSRYRVTPSLPSASHPQ